MTVVARISTIASGLLQRAHSPLEDKVILQTAKPKGKISLSADTNTMRQITAISQRFDCTSAMMDTAPVRRMHPSVEARRQGYIAA